MYQNLSIHGSKTKRKKYICFLRVFYSIINKTKRNEQRIKALGTLYAVFVMVLTAFEVLISDFNW